LLICIYLMYMCLSFVLNSLYYWIKRTFISFSHNIWKKHQKIAHMSKSWFQFSLWILKHSNLTLTGHKSTQIMLA
jgi:hypothetical protein